jgi:hypothetical protein
VQVVRQSSFDDAVSEALNLVSMTASDEEVIAEAKAMLVVQLGSHDLDFSAVEQRVNRDDY